MVTNKLKNLGINSPTPPGQTRTCFSGHKIRLEELSKPVKIMKKTIHLKDFEGNWKYCCMKPPHGKKILVVSSWYATDLPNHWLEITRNLNYHSARDIPWYIIPIKSHEIPLTPIKSLLLMGKPPMHPHDLPRLVTRGCLCRNEDYKPPRSESGRGDKLQVGVLVEFDAG